MAAIDHRPFFAWFTGAERLTNSESGNPQWLIRYETEINGKRYPQSSKTGEDAAVGYDVLNYTENGIGQWFRFVLDTKTSRIVGMTREYPEGRRRGQHYVTRGGKVVSPYFVEENDAHRWLQDHQGNSNDYALKHGGFGIHRVEK